MVLPQKVSPYLWFFPLAKFDLTGIASRNIYVKYYAENKELLNVKAVLRKLFTGSSNRMSFMKATTEQDAALVLGQL